MDMQAKAKVRPTREKEVADKLTVMEIKQIISRRTVRLHLDNPRRIFHNTSRLVSRNHDHLLDETFLHRTWDSF